MFDITWWTLFTVFVVLIVLFAGRFIYDVVSDTCCEENCNKLHQDLNEYDYYYNNSADDDIKKRSNNDIADLSRYKTDFRTILKNIECKDESDLSKLLIVPPLEQLTEESGSIEMDHEDNNNIIIAPMEKWTIPIIMVEENGIPPTEQLFAPPIESPAVKPLQSIDVEQLTDEERRILEKLNGIQGETEIYARQIPHFLGGKKNLQYFEMNEKFILYRIALREIDCKDNETLKGRKEEVMAYVKECQDELKEKASEYVY